MATLLRNGTLVDGTGTDPIANAAVLIGDDGSVEYAGAESGLDAKASAGADVVDVGGNTIMPGFFDCHTHLAFVTGTDDIIFPTVNQEAMYTYAQMIRNLKVTLEAGVTSVRDLCGMDRGFVESIDDGLLVGPRMTASCGGITAPGGHFDFTMPCGFDPVGAITAPNCEVFYINGPYEARNATRRLIAKGAKVIKITTTGGVMSPNDSSTDTGLTLDEVQAIVDIASTHMGGIPVTSHAQGPAGIEVALKAGLKCIEHGTMLTDDQVTFMAANDVGLVPTLIVALTPPSGDVLPQVLKKLEIAKASAVESYQKALKAGVKIGLGTDVGLAPKHGTNLQELRFMLDNGATPMQAFLAGTKNAAEIVGTIDAVGTLEVGKRGDVVVGRGDATSDFEGVLRGLGDTDTNILRVYKDGDLVVSR